MFVSLFFCSVDVCGSSRLILCQSLAGALNLSGEIVGCLILRGFFSAWPPRGGMTQLSV